MVCVLCGCCGGGERIRGLKWSLDGRIHACKTGERTRHDKIYTWIAVACGGRVNQN